MKCPKCEGRGFIEIKYGLIQKSCPDCKGKGTIADSGNGDHIPKPRKTRKRRVAKK